MVELLVVVIIVVLVVVFAVPSFKKAQENNKNQRAQAVLLDIAGAVKNYRVYEPPDNSGLTLPAAGKVNADTFNLSSSNQLNILFKDNLLKPIAWDSGTSDKYYGYNFFVCSDYYIAGCCGKPNAVAAMVNTEAGSGRFNPSKCAWVTEQGSIQTDYDLGTGI